MKICRLLLVVTALSGIVTFSTNAHAQGGGQFTWTGLYIGGHAGGAWTDIDQTSVAGAPHYYNAGQTVGLSPSGFFGGGHLGGNFQTGNIVVGAEVSLSGGNIDDQVAAVGPFATNSYETELSSIFTATARLGYAQDRWLGYIKGGYASAKIETFQTESPAFSHSGRSEERHSGWTIGGGVEHAITDSIVIGVEYNYLDLEDRNHGIADTNPQGATETIRVDPDGISTATARVSVKF